jgi:pimeloyl-ACP methyl ester carboxylesterase
MPEVLLQFYTDMEALIRKKSPIEGPRRLTVNGNSLALWERPGVDPPILFLHGASFHSCCWDEVISRIPGRRCVAFDSRGHGQSAKPDTPCKWREFGQDAAEVAHLLGLRGATGVGHSLGGHAIALAAGIRPESFAEIVLFDPVILPASLYVGSGPEFTAILRRRNRWHSWTEFFYRIKDRTPFDLWHRKVLLDYCEYGLLAAPDGDGWELACPPLIEAAIYQHSTDRESNIYAEIAGLKAATTVVRARCFRGEAGGFSSSRTAEDLASKFTNAVDVYLPQYSHFLPMEAPHVVADIIISRKSGFSATRFHQ